MTKYLVIVGNGEFAEIAYERFTNDSSYHVVAFTVEREYIKNNKFLKLPVVPFEELENLYPPHIHHIFVAITYTELNQLREQFYSNVKLKGYKFATYISSNAQISHDIKIGENCFIFDDNNIQYSVKIGNNIIMWSGCYIGDHTEVKDNCFLASHSVIACHSELGKNCFIGLNSTIIDHIKISDYTVIGAGAVVVKNTKKGRVYAGNPAKTLDKNSFRVLKTIKAHLS
jgi:sugar O-acyltransferase (sialic acid O-acetyltransferase NeuD family)